MASDITLAVGDGARRMTYAELAAVRGISALSAERLVRRHKRPRQTGNDGIVRVLVFLTEVRKGGGNYWVSRPGRPPVTFAPDIRGVIREVVREMSGAASPDVSGDIREDIRAPESANAVLRQRIADKDTFIADLRQRLDAAERGPGTDPMTAIGIQTRRPAGLEHAWRRCQAQARFDPCRKPSSCCARTSNASASGRIEPSGKLRTDASGSTSYRGGLMVSIPTSPTPAPQR